MRKFYMFSMFWCWGFVIWSARGLLVQVNLIDTISLIAQLLMFGVFILGFRSEGPK